MRPLLFLAVLMGTVATATPILTPVTEPSVGVYVSSQSVLEDKQFTIQRVKNQLTIRGAYLAADKYGTYAYPFEIPLTRVRDNLLRGSGKFSLIFTDTQCDYPTTIEATAFADRVFLKTYGPSDFPTSLTLLTGRCKTISDYYWTAHSQPYLLRMAR